MTEQQETVAEVAATSIGVEPRWRRRRFAMGGYAALFVAWLTVVGLPTDPIVMFAWLWLATVAWNVEAPARQHVAFVRDWWPALALLMGYMYSRGLADEVGMPVHVTSAIRFDEWLFGGHLPTATLQDAWCGEPCTWSSQGAWYDTVFATTYYSHFFVGLTVAVVLWLRSRDAWLPYMRRYIGLNLFGLAVYILYPLAPPWWASDRGFLDEPVERITSRGWDAVGLQSARLDLGPDMLVGNAVAAMPSLHTAVSTLVALYGITRLRHPARWLLLAYPALMSVTLVYTGEHYVIDVLAGYVAAVLVMVAASAWERWRAGASDRERAST
ncbi:MAG TPA: phosphatase PAP2 family protein [Nocardioidaceae bacterium]|nr:phosphatase PAP2 family protein [Nocardioidaceae bacterium]